MNNLANGFIEGVVKSGASLKISYDVDYGVDKQTGWSISVNGRCHVQFAATLEEAVLQTLMDLAIMYIVEHKD